MGSRQIGRYHLQAQRPWVMGILNITPDSFSDGGCYDNLQKAVAQAWRLIEAGADILDIGGESTRPNAVVVSQTEELARVIPVLEALQACGVPLSLDTQKPAVMAAALAVGLDMINDVNAFQAPGAVECVAPTSVALCVMHMQGSPQTMQQNPQYRRHVVEDVRDFLARRWQVLQAAGVSNTRVWLDPGFGFGKSTAHNFALLKHLNAIRVDNLPLLVGLSRKSMLGAVTGGAVDARLVSSVVAATLAMQQGAQIVRVHDVAETVEARKVLQAMMEAE